MASTGDPAKEQIITEHDAKKSLSVDPTDGGSPGKYPHVSLPRDKEEWKELAAKAAPWLIGAAVVLLGAAAVNHHEKHGDWHFWARRAEREARASGYDAKRAARSGFLGLKRDAGRAAADAGDRLADAAAGAKNAATAAGGYAADRASELADASRTAAQRAEAAAGRVGAKAGALASAAEESTGRAMKQAGKLLEKDGSTSKDFFEGKVQSQKPWWQFW